MKRSSFNLSHIFAISLTVFAGTTSVYLATLTDPTQPQKDLGRTTNQVFLLGSQSLLKRKDDDRDNKF